MAQLARPAKAQPDIDYHLDYQFGAWESVPDYAEQWRAMAAIDREVFQLEWAGITEDHLTQLQRWAAQGQLTPAQCALPGSACADRQTPSHARTIARGVRRSGVSR